MKLYSPKELADRSPYSVDYIRRNAEAFGFVRPNENSRKWVATEDKQIIDAGESEKAFLIRWLSAGEPALNKQMPA